MSARSDVATIPGWYGKLPTLGDFASRRLEADFVEPWDLWLGESLQAQRSAFGDAWLDAYRDTPPWRFLLSPGALRGVRPGLAFAGVLVPSVDRVGRHFPLTLVASLSRLPERAAEFDTLLAWLHRLEDTALDALQGDWTIDDLENALADLGAPGTAGSDVVEDRLSIVRRGLADAVARRGGFVDIAGVSSRADLAAIFSAPPGAPTTPPPPLRGIAIWIADTPGRPQLLVSDGLPRIDDFVRMFSGGSGARSVGAVRGAAVDEEDPLATLPQGLGPPILAAAAPSRDDDLLALFGVPASDAPAGEPAAARELLPDDDILALFAVGGDSAAGAPEAPDEVIPEHDVLGLFAAGAEAPPIEPGAAAKDDDILALFSAGDTPFSDLGAGAAPAKDDLLGLFEVPPQTVPFGEAPAEPPGPQDGTAGPDILDLFGVAPAKPDGKEAK